MSFAELGRNFVVILCDGRRAVKPPLLRVECPPNQAMPVPGQNKTALPELRQVLLPTDFSGCANYALPYATAIARATGATIVCLHVVEPVVPAVGYTGLAEPMPIADISEQLEDSAERELPRLTDREECAGLNVEEIIVHGDAAAEIVRVAAEREVDLIVISSHGRTGLGRIIFGSTAEAVVRHARCPVLVVKPAEQEKEEEA